MNNRFKVVIVDDEPLAIEVILEYLKDYPGFVVAGTFTKSKEAILNITALQPELVFLDIKMPDADGFTILESVMHVHKPYVIFTTAFDEYAVKAFEVNAIGYLLKPLDREKFRLAINRFTSIFKGDKLESFYSGIKNLLENRPVPVEALERILVKDARSIQFIEVKDVIYFEASGEYVKAVTLKAEKIINYTMAKLEKELPPELFQRIHRSHIVNVKEIVAFLPHFNGEYVVSVSNGAKLKMSRNYKDNLTRIFKGL